MQNQFSPALIKKCQQLIFKKSGKKISKNKAELYLEKFAQLMLVTIKIKNYAHKNTKTTNSH